jgi:hypothetical protein
MRRFGILAVLALVACVLPLRSALGTGPSEISPPPTSDFNGDGYADLAVGVPFEDIGQITDAGGVNVLYGSATGLQATAPPDQFWSQNSPGVEGGAEEFDDFGFSVAAGDFNNDGFSDLAIGVPQENIGPIEDAGGVNVLYGSAIGLQTSSPADQFWSQDSPGVEGGAENFDSFGFSVASGDFNNDGFSDLAIGAALEGVRGADPAPDGAGAVNVLYGSAGGLQATSPSDQVWHQNSPSVQGRAETFDLFGASVGAGDFNNDGFSDLAIGVPGEGVKSADRAGAVNVLYGSAGGLQATSPNDQLWHQNSPSVDGTAEAGDSFGEFVGTGDFNDDGFADLTTSVASEDLGGLEDAGALSVLYGSAGGLQATSPPDQLWTQDSPNVEDQSEAFDRFGFGPAVGDFNGDGFDDLSVSAILEGVGAIAEAGAVNVLYGSAGGLQATAPADQFWHQDSPNVEDQAEDIDLFGSALAGADFNDDGFADLAIGVQLEDVDGIFDAGAANVLYGSLGGLQTTAPADQFWHQNSPDVEGGAEDGDLFGFAFGTREPGAFPEWLRGAR